MNPNEIRIAIQAWAAKYHARIDRDVTTAWPDLELRLRNLVDNMSFKELVLGPGSDFQNDRLKPMVENWAHNHISPIVEDAEKDLRNIYLSVQELDLNSHGVPGEWGGTLSFRDIWAPGAAVGGVVVGVAAVVGGISKVAVWIVLSALVVNWYLVIAGVVVGVFLFALGFHGTLGLKAELRDRFRDKLLPKIKEAILGEAFNLDGKQVLSLRRQLKCMIEQSKTEALPS